MLLVPAHSTLKLRQEDLWWGLITGPLPDGGHLVSYRGLRDRVRWPALAELWRMSSLQNVIEAK